MSDDAEQTLAKAHGPRSTLSNAPRATRGGLGILLLLVVATMPGCGAWIGAGLLIASAGGSGGGGGGTVVEADDVPQVVELELQEATIGAGRPDDLSRVGIGFRLIERSAEPAILAVEFSQDGFATVQSATIVSGALVGAPTSGDGVRQTLVWDATADGLTGEETVEVRVQAADATGSGAAVTVAGRIGNLPPVASNLQVEGASRTGTIPFSFDLTDSAGDLASVAIEFKLASEPDSSFRTLTPNVGSTTALSPGSISFAWDSLAPEPLGIGAAVTEVEIRVTPIDGLVNGQGAEQRLATVEIENNQRPVATASGFESSVDSFGPVALPFTVTDNESDLLQVIAQWKTLSQSFPDLNDRSLNPLVDPGDARFVGSSVEDPTVRAALFAPENSDIRQNLQVVSESTREISVTVRQGSTALAISVPGLEQLSGLIGLEASTLTLSSATAAVTSYTGSQIMLAPPGLPATPVAGSIATLTMPRLQQASLPASPSGRTYRMIWDTAADLDHIDRLPIQIKVSPFDLRSGSASPTTAVTRDLFGAIRFRDDTAIAIPQNMIDSTGPLDFFSNRSVAGDVNGDGVDDLVVSGKGIRILLADTSSGRFPQAPSVVIDTPKAATVVDVAIGDLNGDGRVDLAAALIVDNLTTPTSFSGRLEVYEQAASGDPFPSVTRQEAFGNPLTAINIGRVNTDALDDLVMSTNVGAVQVFLQTAGGLPVTPNQVLIATGSVSSLELRDVDSDNRTDVILTAQTTPGLCEIFIQTPSGFSTTPSQTLTSGGPLTQQAVVADLNNDGRTDVALVNNSLAADAGLSLYFRRSTGELPNVSDLDIDGLRNSFAIAAGDFDSDGRTDLAVGARSPGTLNTGEVAFYFGGENSAAARMSRQTLAGPVTVVATLQSVSGQRHLACASQNPDSVELFEPANIGSLIDSRDSKLDSAEFPSGIAAGDLNGDGVVDLAVVSLNGERVQLYFQDSAGNFPRSASASMAVGGGPHGPAILDLNGDSLLDLAVVSQDQRRLEVFFQMAGGVFSAAADLMVPLGTKPNDVATGDFNGDGRLDVAISDQDDFTISIVSRMSNTLAVTKVLSVAGGNSIVYALDSGDVNGDGRDDLVVAVDGFSDQIRLFLQTAGGLPSVPDATLTATNSSATILVADLSGDGAPDVATADTGTGEIRVFLQSNGAISGTPTVLTPPSGEGLQPESLVAADINADGRNDLMVLGSFSPDLTLYEQTPMGVLQRTQRFTASLSLSSIVNFNSQRFLAADLNGDGRTDIAIANARTGDRDFQDSISLIYQR